MNLVETCFHQPVQLCSSADEDILNTNVLTIVDNSYVASEKTYNYFDAAEIKSFIKAINAFTTDSTDNDSFTFTVTLDSISNMDRAILEDVLESKLAHGLISNSLISINEASNSEIIETTEGLVYHIYETRLDELVNEKYIAKETILAL